MTVPGENPGGVLLLVATPLGNLADLSPRAREALAGADIVACEDTRTTANLLRLSGISSK
jgi:16S rRNA (cytidine1402-2'-O)-methyltransferase